MVQIVSRSEGKPCLRHDQGSEGSVDSLGSFFEGEQAHSCEEPGGLFAACELGNGTWSVPFPDRARALPRETVACQRQDGGVVKLGDATEGVIGLPQKSRQRVLWDNFRAPAKILQSKRFVGKGGAGLKALPRPKEGSARFALLRRGGRSRLIVARRSR